MKLFKHKMYGFTIFCIMMFNTFISCVSAQENKPQLLLEKEGVEYAYPHLSKDNSKILFQSNESGKWKICMIDSEGLNLKELTSGVANDYFADWSPDNSRICFVSDRTGNEEIYMMNSDGSNIVQITNNKKRNIHPYFSPDGKKILFNSTFNSSGDLEVYQMNTDGTNITRITNSEDNESCARMSPNNKHITYLKNNDKGLDDLFLYSVDDASEVNLTNTPEVVGWPSWAPNGNQIIFSSLENDGFRIFKYDLNEKSVTQITNPVEGYDDCRANISKNGKLMVFNRQHDSESGRTNALYIVHL